MRRLLIALASLLLGWLGAAHALPAPTAAAPPAAHVYNYDDHHSSAPWTYATTERGPPATYNDATIHDADGLWSLGASARTIAAATPAICDYDVLASFVQTSRGSSRGIQGRVGGVEADLAGVERSDVAAKSADDFVDLASSTRRNHILNGDATGGGHLWPGLPGKTPFQQGWSGDRIMHEVSDVATDPSLQWRQITGVPGAALTKKGAPVRYEVIGNRGGIDIKVILEPGGEGIITAHPW